MTWFPYFLWLNDATTLENNKAMSQKLKMELLYDPAISFLSIYRKELKLES